MATGDLKDSLGRIKATLPAQWFPSSSPLLDGVLSGFANVVSDIWAQLQFVKLQTRIKTATGGFLDLISGDYFGFRLPRLTSETDASFQSRIVAEVVRPRATRGSITRVITDLTGRAPNLFEPARPTDTGGWDVAIGWDIGTAGNGWPAGGWGDTNLNNQIFVQVYRPKGAGIPQVSGWDSGAGGWDTGSFALIDMNQITGIVTDPQIYAAVDSVMPAGCIGWVQINTLP